MAKKKNATVAGSEESKGFETFDLLTETVFDPIAQEKLKKEQDDAELKSIRESMRDAQWTDVLSCLFDMKPSKNKKSFTYENLSKFTIKNSYFMILQGYSHLHPREANMLNVKGINEVDATNIIRNHVRYKYQYKKFEAIKCFYPNNNKNTQKIEYVNADGKNKSREINDDDIKEFCRKARMNSRDYEMCIELYGKQAMETLVCQFLDDEDVKPNDIFNKIKKESKKIKVDYDNDSERIEQLADIADELLESVNEPVEKAQEPKKTAKPKKTEQKKAPEPVVASNSLFDDIAPVAPQQTTVTSPATPSPATVEPSPVNQPQPAELKAPQIKMTPIIQGVAPTAVVQEQPKPKKKEIVIDENCPLMFVPTDIKILDNIAV